MKLKSMPSSLANINRSCPGCIKIYNIYTEETKMDNRQYIQNISGEVHGSVNMAGGDISYNNEKTEKIYELLNELDIENPIIRINTAFKGCSSLEKISVLPRIYHN